MGEEVMYYHTDHLGSTRLLTDQTGTPATAVEYSPFGKEQLTGEKERYLFTGQEKDSTGLYYYRARYYDLETGRFLTRDTWAGDYKKPQTLNKYVYCLNNPLKYNDPSGKRVLNLDPDDMAAQNSGEGSSQMTEEEKKAYDYAYILSKIVTLKLIAACDPNGPLKSKEIMKAAEGIFDDPEMRKAFEEGWMESYEKTSLDYASKEATEERLQVELNSLEGDLQCLMDLTSDQLLSIPEAMMVTPWKALEALQTAIYVAEEFYNLTCTDKYGPPPSSLDDLCKKKEDGTCSGTTLLCISLLLAALVVFMKKEKRRLP